MLDNQLNQPLAELLPQLHNAFTHSTHYFGIQTLKNPLDFWVYQEIVFEVRPDIIIEIGNKNGGSTLALAHTLDLLDNGQIIGIDLSHRTVPPVVTEHPRITLIEDDAIQALSRVTELIQPHFKVLVIEDSSHTYHNTLAVLRAYGALVTEESFFIVEDTILRHGLPFGPVPGAYEAVHDFLKENDDFYIDSSREKYTVTWNVNGFLRKSKNRPDSVQDQVIKSASRLTRLRQTIAYLFVPPFVFLVINYFRNQY